MSDQVPSSEIKNFSEFLGKCLNRKIVGYTMESFTKKGENYGGVLQHVEVQVAGIGCYDEVPFETVHMVSKTSVVDPSYVEVFQPEITFVKENGFYSDVLPTIKNFEEISHVPFTERIDAFVHCYGSRISLDPSKSTF